MPKVICSHCFWEGTTEEIKLIVEPNMVNEEDKTLYEISVCPDCQESITDADIIPDDNEPYDPTNDWELQAFLKGLV